MTIEGSIEVEGEHYEWSSPTLVDLEEFEAKVGPITDVGIVNSVKGRGYLAFLCLREKNRNITLAIVRGWRSGVWSDLWRMIKQAIPLFAEEGETAARRDQSLPPVGGPAGGPQVGSSGTAEPLSRGAAQRASEKPEESLSPSISSGSSSSVPAGNQAAPDESG